jgi:hypothetical protein
MTSATSASSPSGPAPVSGSSSARTSASSADRRRTAPTASGLGAVSGDELARVRRFGVMRFGLWLGDDFRWAEVLQPGGTSWLPAGVGM